MTVTDAAVDILLKRGLKRVSPDEDKYTFNRDVRHRMPIEYVYTHEELKKLIGEMTCPVLIVKAKRGNFYEPEEVSRDILEVYERNPKFKYVEVEGLHHVHLNEPEVVAPRILDFLKEHDL